MRRLLFAVLLPLSLGGCFSYHDTAPAQPSRTTLVVPPGSTVTCANGLLPPC